MDINIEFFYNGGGFTDTDGLHHTKTLQWLSVVQCTRGYYNVSVDGSPFTRIPAGSCFIAPAAVFQDIYHRTEGGLFSSRYVFIDARFPDRTRFEEHYGLPVILPERLNGRMNALMDAVFADGVNADGSKALPLDISCRRTAIAYDILALLLECAEKRGAKQDIGIDAAIKYINENIKGRITVPELAKAANMSQSGLFKRFASRMGESPIAYANRVKIMAASSLFETGETDVAGAALRCGFENPFYFSRVFKKITGLSPSEYISAVQLKR